MLSAVVIALAIILPALADAAELGGVADAPAASALVSNPCPSPPPMPQAMAHDLEHLLEPGKLEGDVQSTFTRPDVQEYLKAVQEQARTDWANLCRYRAADTNMPQSAHVVFMGDSITEFWAVADPGLFSHGVVGRGISGQTSPQMLLRFFQD